MPRTMDAGTSVILHLVPSPGRLAAAALVVVALALLPGAAWGQAPDTAAAADVARRAQRRFESVRRGSLPLVEPRGTPRCDATIGTFCYWYDPTDTRPRAPEHPRVHAARKALLTLLDSLGRAAPMSGEIAGQRVRYRLDAGDTAAAVGVAESDCHATRWWCAALTGFARHAATEFRAAEAAFDSALAAMEPERRCAWEDISVVLPPRARSRLRSRPCAERTAMSRRILWLATPVLASRGNDFRTELLARRTAVMLEAHVAPVNDARPRGHAAEFLIRYGRAEWWTRTRPVASATQTTQVVSHERVPSYYFLPSDRVLLDTTALPAASDWSPDAEAPTVRHAPAYAARWREIPSQVARFTEGDSAVIVAAFDASGDTAVTAPLARLAWSAGPRDASIGTPGARIMRGTLELRVASPPRSGYGLIEVSVVDTAARAVTRSRTALEPLRAVPFGVSDLLLFAPAPRGDVTPRPRAEAVAAALPSLRIVQPQVGVYWESYATTELSGPITIGLTVERVGRSWLNRVAVRAGLSERDRPLRIGWQDAPPSAAASARRSVVLQLGALADGEYLVRLTERAADGTEATSERRVVLARSR